MKTKRIVLKEGVLDRCLELFDTGKYTYKEIAQMVGYPLRIVQNAIKMSKRPETICWSCKNARADRCSWFLFYTPVEGWEAIEFKHYYGLTSYSVVQCPNYEREERPDDNRRTKRADSKDVHPRRPHR